MGGVPLGVLAHEASEATPIWQRWTVDPAIYTFAVAGICYEIGRRNLRRRFGPGRVVSTWQVVSFWVGVPVTLIALVSPIDPIADDLFSVHMVQHLLLGLVGPLLIIVGAPVVVMSRAFPSAARARVMSMRRVLRRGGLVRSSVPCAIVFVALEVGMLAFWHVPFAYDTAVRDPLVHDVEHLSFFVTGMLLWWVVVGARWQNRSGLAVVYLFLAGLPMGAIAALLTLASQPLYTAHLYTTAEWGLTPLEDQQLAGAIMWVPGGIVYLAAASVLFVRWLAAGPRPGEQRLSWRV